MKTIIITTFLALLFLNGCSQYKDPETAQRIAELESQKNLDEFDKMELQDLKEQGQYKNEFSTSKSCNF